MKGYKHLTEFDRNKIARMRKEGATMREIGAALHVSAATVCREIKRGTYTYMNADYIEVTEYIPERSQARYRANMAAKGGPLKIGSDRRYAETLEALRQPCMRLRTTRKSTAALKRGSAAKPFMPILTREFFSA